MTSTTKDPVVVVLQLSGGNDYFNTVIPFTSIPNLSLIHISEPTRPY